MPLPAQIALLDAHSVRVADVEWTTRQLSAALLTVLPSAPLYRRRPEQVAFVGAAGALVAGVAALICSMV
ncbi:hypothetical protein [Pseudorhodoferax sp.]|uniref:hypothetical protein n=1 Tax=Pseudorhodoferax sp. TaxID=1993553 RepID=UPI0039E4B3CE